MISVRDLTKSFGEVIAVDGVSFTIQEDEAYAIFGPSGSGKTTLLRLIAGLDLPDEGEIHLNGRLMSKAGGAVSPHHRGIGFMFQTSALWPHMTVTENILFGLHQLTRETASQRLEEILEQVHLHGLQKRYPAELSGGERRRVALARTLAPKPKILLMDEPLTNLDPDLKATLLKLVKETVSIENVSLLYVTHDQEEAKVIAGENLLKMVAGQILSP